MITTLSLEGGEIGVVEFASDHPNAGVSEKENKIVPDEGEEKRRRHGDQERGYHVGEEHGTGRKHIAVSIGGVAGRRRLRIGGAVVLKKKERH